MVKYIAKRPILYRNRTYRPGDELPYDAALTPIWVKNGSARKVKAEKPAAGSEDKQPEPAAPTGDPGDKQPEPENSVAEPKKASAKNAKEGAAK